jgi:predicted nucleotidyltransferase
MTQTSRPATAEDVKRIYELLMPYEQMVDLDGVPVRTITLEGLLLTKQTQRPQDIQDALVLQRAIAAQRK